MFADVTKLPRHRQNAAKVVTVAVLAVIASTLALVAGAWDSIPNLDSIRVESPGPSARLARADGAWVVFAPNLSVDCSPPRGCYAKTQRIHYDFSCSPRYAVMTERISMDLNGAIVKHEVVEESPRYTPSYDAGAIGVLEAFCPSPPRRE